MKKNSIVCIFCVMATCIFSQVPSYKQDITNYRSQNWKGLIKDPRTTLTVSDSIYLDYFPIKEKNKVYCSVTLLNDQQPFDMPTYSGQVKSFIKYAIFQFNWKNKKTNLVAYRNLQQITSPIYKDYLFVPFKDLTSGRQTYGGGRYIDVKISQINAGHILLDLNQIYNPWCAYSDGYNCPIPPSENHLNISLKVGEKMFKKKH